MMTLSELNETIAKIESENPNAKDMEIGPVFYHGNDIVITYIDKITIEPEAELNKTSAIGIYWQI